MKTSNLKKTENRVPIEEVFKGRVERSKVVEVAGWVLNSRELGKIRFILLRDSTRLIQITAVKGKVNDGVFDLMNKITRESVISVKGKVVDSKQAPGGKEIIPEELVVLNAAEDLPIDIPFNPTDESKTELPKRLDYRFLDFHRKKTQAVFKIQNTIANSFREFFYNKNFIEMQPPGIIGAASEGGTDLFEVKYFEKKAFLAQSPQLYKQMIACSPIEKTFMITPVWRAEKHNTTRHINEIRQMDIEVAFADQFSIMKLLEEVVQHIVKQLLEENKEELNFLGVKLKIPEAVYLPYEEAIKKVSSSNSGKSDDFTPEQERKLCEMNKGDIVFTHSWPVVLKPFYIMPKDEKKDAKISEGFDALYGGMEICSGGQRIHLPELLVERIKAKGLNPKNFKDYIDSFRYGAPPHAGWSIGLERLTQIICGLDNVKEATMFPRDRDRLTP
ncbi:aspartate--tRNA(Asn) ligase [Candidatus Pacearchaeota archaeon]|nr:aspartate--tRNA(Asn) ligase [Candidatus Pacearchaeota archaeon]